MARSYERSLLIRGGSSCFSDTPHREGIGGGVLVMVGVWLGGVRSFDSVHQGVN